MNRPQLFIAVLAIAGCQACTTYNIAVPKAADEKAANLVAQAHQLAGAAHQSGNLTPQQSATLEKAVYAVVDESLNTVQKKAEQTTPPELVVKKAVALQPDRTQYQQPGVTPVASGQANPVPAAHPDSKRFGERYWAELLAMTVLKCIPLCFK